MKNPNCDNNTAYNNFNHKAWLLIITLIATVIGNFTSLEKVQAGTQWDDFFNKLGNAVDITDKKSIAGKFVSQFDFTDPNSAFCKGIKTDGAAVAAESVSVAYGAPLAGTAITSILQGTCTQSGGNQQQAQDAASNAIIASWNAAIKIRELEVQGRIEEAKIIQDSLVEMTKVKTAADVAKARINLEAITVRADADVKIEELRQQGRVEEAKILATALQRQTEAQEQGKTERVKIETETLLALTKANNEVQLREIDLNAALKRRELTNNLISQGLESILKYFLSKAELDREREITKREIESKKIELEIARVNAPPTSNPQLDHNLALVQSWGLTTTVCNNDRIVSIDIDNKQYCVFPTDWLSAGQYIYDRSRDHLEPLNSDNDSNPVPSLINSPQQDNTYINTDEGFE